MANKRNLNNSIRQIAMSFAGTIVRIAVIAVCVLLISKAGKYAYDFGFRIFTEEPMSSSPGRDVSVTIVQGDSLMDTCEMLTEKGLVRDARLTWVQKKVSVYNNDIKPGIYTLNTSMTADEMFAIIAGKEGEEEEKEEEDIDIQTQADPLEDGLSHPDPLVETPLDGEAAAPADAAAAEDAAGDAAAESTEGGE